MASSPIKNRALWLSSFTEPLSIVELPVPSADAGTVVVQILAAGLAPYTHLIHSGKIPGLNLTPPLVPNPSGIGRVHAVGPDAVRLKAGDLVFIDGLVRGRDDPDICLMPGHMTGGHPKAQKLMQGVWRDGSLQQYQKVPLETCFVLDEERLIGELGYDPAILHTLSHYSVAAGALLEAADVKVAETVIIGPSGGSFGGLAVEVALAAGANVIALGRSETKLKVMREKLNNSRLSTVAMTGDVEVDAAAIMDATPGKAGAEVFNDWTPGELQTPPYLSAAALALKKDGRIVLSGGAGGNLQLPYGLCLLRNLKLVGKWMCERRTVDQVIRMVTQGQLKIGKESGSEIKLFGLEEHEEAVEHARKYGGWRNYTAILPNRN
ncbi:isopropanol dehydrogenase [Colletotrichum truncatum]|uniref:Isopropanol dehydrogenase n=1 Tax=Colletotrichum truncatum TaxID=5467 RepID=A0ACC3YD31_COLTU|nr:isopropanol dehydrogenase [Colletotrichum truncatum]KAF6783537.1 isopropanol dehydrogenase [Colletotrichum truncatum]